MRFIKRTTFASRLGRRFAVARSATGNDYNRLCRDLNSSELFKIYPAVFILNLAAACGRFKFKISSDLLGLPASLISVYLS